MSEKRYNGFSEDDLRMIAHKKVNFRMSVKIHFGVYIISCILLVVLNGLTVGFPWFFFPIFGWLVGLAEHLTAYLVYARGVYPMAKRGVIFHVVSYIFGILLLFVINRYAFTVLWFLIPAFFWGVGLIIHIIVYLVYHRVTTHDEDELKSKKERAVDRELAKMKKKFL
ncbi:MAG: 2TM domain-containing protein [Candidatus Lokiarchaeota archaeon]|nr:2TM domain-containing protein [Candidatus Lokiarchaeota archaeon]